MLRETTTALPQRRRAPLGLGLILGLVALGLAVVASMAVGAKGLPPSAVVDALLHHDPANPDHVIVWEVRIPRTLIGVLAGAALGLAGAIIQGVTRNPLADPGILGVNAGASLCIVAAISLAGIQSMTGYVWFAFLGAGLAAVLVYGIGSLGRDRATPLKIALTGAACEAAFRSLTTGILVTDNATYEQFRFWQVGALAGRDSSVVTQALPFLVVGFVLALASARALNGLAMGDDVARGLGVHVNAGRALCALAVVILCGTATAMAGPIAFVGLMVPHAARLITGPDHRWLLPYSMVLAPLVLLAADVVGRVLAQPGELQVGIVTAAIGAPVFIALVRRKRVRG
ncbi:MULTISPECIES: iron ABC transporter permease [Amycolatopsis]|uniref:Iron chelate uptake ABC transporter family permease subunit n=1 Tax=Amycolatopsis tucumanensis TaxID=401106 RepID=A0ABP7JEA2_9PSEU|nr:MULTISPECIES: iron chelate uptake ABC transporter family permease subunit [Amycolatopsis]MCF6426020.1 iron chelate uptake ABC transporter family permease subunit [Amycolatopsis tucumanensis]